MTLCYCWANNIQVEAGRLSPVGVVGLYFIVSGVFTSFRGLEKKKKKKKTHTHLLLGVRYRSFVRCLLSVSLELKR